VKASDSRAVVSADRVRASIERRRRDPRRCQYGAREQRCSTESTWQDKCANQLAGDTTAVVRRLQ
jgi:hypothetical protein